MGSLRTSVAVVLPLLLWAQVAAAQPSLRVRAETRIELLTSRESGALHVKGTLRDDNGTALAGRDVTIRVRSARGDRTELRTVRTDGNGGFELPLVLPLDRYEISATFDGDALHDRVDAERPVDLARADVRLRVQVPPEGRFDLDLREHVVTVSAESQERGDGLWIELLDELDRRLGDGHTDAAGHVRFVIPSEALGPPGAGRIKARSRLDDRRAEAQTEVPVVRFRTTELTLAADRESAAPGDTVVIGGELRDSAGPLSDRAVGVFAGEEHRATVLTDADGRYRAELALDATEEGTLELRARFESDAPGRQSSESLPVLLSVSASPAMPWGWLLLPIAISMLALFLLARRAPVRPERATAPPAPPPVGIEAVGRRARRPEQRGIAGSVLDHRDDEPAPGAMVTLVSPRTAIPIPVGEDGRFEIEEVPDGPWVLRVEARGYLPSEGNVAVPHRGEWSDVRVRLLSLRALALEPFRRLAQRLLPAGRLWSIWTTREVAARAVPTRTMAEITDRVEAACYGELPPTGADVEAIEQNVREADRDLGN